MLETILIIISLVAIIVSTYTDIRWREVPDWISYGLIFSAIGIRSIYSITLGFNILLFGIYGFIIAFFIGYLFYRLSFWGGGDSKLLMGLGIVFGINYPISSKTFTLVIFLLALFMLGAIYSFFWMIFQAIKNKSAFKKEFSKLIREQRTIHMLIITITILFSLLALLNPFLLILTLFPIPTFYLLLFTQSVETSCFQKEILTSKLVPGDWVAQDMMIGKHFIQKKHSLEQKEIDLIKSKNIKSVLIKEGVPFVPSFLFAYLFILFSKPILQYIQNLFII